MPELEEPGWPNLRSGAPSPGSTFLNAFYAMSQINMRKQALQDQIAKMEMQLQKQRFDEAFKEQDFQRKLEAQQMTGALRERALEISDEYHRAGTDIAYQRLNLAEEKGKAAYEQAKKQQEDFGAFSQEVEDLKKQHPPGTLDYAAGLSTIRGRHMDALQSQAGKRYDQDLENEHKTESALLDKHANMAHKTLRLALQNSTKGGAFTMQDLERDPSYFRREQGDVIIAERPVLGPDKKTMTWEPIPASEVHALSTEDQTRKWPGMRQRRKPADQFDQWKDLYKTMMDYAGGGKLSPDISPQTSLPRDKSKRISGRIYDSAVGPVLWDGENLIKQ